MLIYNDARYFIITIIIIITVRDDLYDYYCRHNMYIYTTITIPPIDSSRA